MSGGSKKVTVGYKYYLDVLAALCHGPIDKLLGIVIGERDTSIIVQTYNDASPAMNTLYLDKPELFGGEKREGGVQGYVDVMWGYPTQARNSGVASFQGENCPAYRGLTTVLFRDFMWAAMNPYFKAPWFRITRIEQGWRDETCWYPEKAAIVTSVVSNQDVAVFNEGFSSLDAWTLLSGNWSGYTLVSGELQIAPGSVPSATIRADLAFPCVLKSIDFDFRLITLGTDDAGVIAFRDGVGNNIFAFIVARQTMTDSLRRPNVMPGSIEEGSGNPVGVAAVEAGVRYHLNATFNYTTDKVLCKITDPADGGSLWGQVEVTLTGDSSTLTSHVIIQNENLLGGGTAQFDNILVNTTQTISQEDMNPAHIIYQGLTDLEWGMGYNTSDIDTTSFTAVADTLYTEGFGLSLIWDQQSSIEEFIKTILNHIDGSLALDMTTGKFKLRLHRNDYIIANLTHLTPSNVIEMKSFQRATYGELANELVVKYTNPKKWTERTIAAQNLASIQTQGGVISTTREYMGITSNRLASRVALRDLATVSTPLAKFSLTTNRILFDKEIGDVIKISWDELGITELPLRILKIDKGGLIDGKIEVEAIEDVFALPSESYSESSDTDWTDTLSPAQPPEATTVYEAPYWEVFSNMNRADMDYLTADYGFGVAAATRSVAASPVYFSLQASADDAGYTEVNTGQFCPTGLLSADISYTTDTFTLTDFYDLSDATLDADNGYLLIDQEYMAVVSADSATGIVMVRRGVLDTIPATHVAGARAYFVSSGTGYDETERTDGETTYYRVCPNTGIDQLPVESAYTSTLTFSNRATRPYPPGQVKVNTTYYPEWIDGVADLAVTWAHRDRLQQTVSLLDYTYGNVGPEAGTTYTLRIYGETDTLIHTFAGISGTSQTYASADESGDSGLIGGAPPTVWNARAAVLAASDAAASDAFGGSVALNADGSIMIVGAYLWEGGATNQGGVYTYDWSGSAWVQRGSVLTASDAVASDFFGIAVALSRDGLVLAVGANSRDTPNTNQGAVYIYDWSGSAWVQRGSPVVAPDGALNDSFGVSAALNLDGTVLIVGAYTWEGTATDQGGVYTFDWSGGAWVQRGSVLTASDAAGSDSFGFSVTLSSDGQVLAVGAEGWEGAALGQGGVYIYDRSGSTWVQRGSVLTATDAAAGDAFGVSTAINLDGTVLIVGAYTWEGGATNQGGVYTYDWSGSAWVQRGSILTASDAAANDFFARGIAVSSNGLILAVGAEAWEDAAITGQGGVYSYYLPATARLNGRLRFELESIRDGLVSSQEHNVTVLREGYGFNYGYYWGGQP